MPGLERGGAFDGLLLSGYWSFTPCPIDSESGNFTDRFQDDGTQRGADPEVGLLLQAVKERSDSGNEGLFFGISKNTQQAYRSKTEGSSSSAASLLVHEHRIGLSFDGQRDGGHLSGIQPRGGSQRGQQLEGSGLFDEVGESQSLKARILCGEPLKLHDDHGGSHDPSIQKPQQFLLPDEAEVKND